MQSVRLMSGLVSVGAIAALASVASAVPITTWSYGSAHLQHLRNDDGTFWVDYDAVNDPNLFPDVISAPLDNGIKLSAGNTDNVVFTVNGNSYIPTPTDPINGGNFRGNRLLIQGTGTIDGAAWQHPNDIIRTTFDFGFGHSGGHVELYGVETSFILLDSLNGFVIGVGSGTGFGETFEPGIHTLGFAFEDRFGAIDEPSNISNAVTIVWEVRFMFDWTSYSPTDTLNFDIPQNSVDIQALTIPAPGAAALVGLAGITALRRRR